MNDDKPTLENPLDPETFDPLSNLYQPADLRRVADPLTLYVKGIEAIITARSQSTAWNWSHNYAARVDRMFGRIKRELIRRGCPLRQQKYEDQVKATRAAQVDDGTPEMTKLERQAAVARQCAAVTQIMKQRRKREETYQLQMEMGADGDPRQYNDEPTQCTNEAERYNGCV